MGSVLNVQPHLDRVDVLIQVEDENTVIPRNSRLFANQSGLIAEPLVDIMPQHPIPDYIASPLADSCKCAPISCRLWGCVPLSSCARKTNAKAVVAWVEKLAKHNHVHQHPKQIGSDSSTSLDGSQQDGYTHV